jgi:hypothetical protein
MKREDFIHDDNFVWTNNLVNEFIKIYHQGSKGDYANARTVVQKMAVFKTKHPEAYKSSKVSVSKVINVKKFFWGLVTITTYGN